MGSVIAGGWSYSLFLKKNYTRINNVIKCGK